MCIPRGGNNVHIKGGWNRPKPSFFCKVDFLKGTPDSSQDALKNSTFFLRKFQHFIKMKKYIWHHITIPKDMPIPQENAQSKCPLMDGHVASPCSHSLKDACVLKAERT